MAVEAGFEPAKIVASKTTALNRLATRQYQLLVCPSCQASDRFVSVCAFSPRRHGSVPVVRKEITMKTLTIIGSTTNPIP